MDRASDTETVDSGLIPDRVKPKNIKIGIHNFPAWRLGIKRTIAKHPHFTVCDIQGGSLT